MALRHGSKSPARRVPSARASAARRRTRATCSRLRRARCRIAPRAARPFPARPRGAAARCLGGSHAFTGRPRARHQACGIPRPARARATTPSRRPRGRRSSASARARSGGIMKTDSVMRRLAAANPYPDGAAPTSDELFVQIIAQPTPARTARKGYRRSLVVALAALVAVAVLASTAFAISQWLGGNVVKPDVTKAEYLEAQQHLVLPPAATWPTLHVDPNSVTSRGGGGGFAVAIAQNAWECYRVRSIRGGDARAAARARAQSERLLRDNVIVAPAGASENWSPPATSSHPYAVYAHDGGYEWVRDTYALAAAGQPQRLMQRCAANSPG